MLLALLACHAPSDDDPTGPDETGTPADETGATGPTGDSLDDPIPLTAATVTDAIDPAGDVDYWSVDLEEGQFLELRTVTVDGDPSDPDFDCDGTYDADPLDTVLRAYGPDGAELLVDDDWGLAVCGRDSLGKLRAAVAGTYTISVTDWNTWEDGGGYFGNPPAGGPDYTYTLYATVGTADTPGGALPEDPVTAVLSGDEGATWTITVSERTWATIWHPIGTSAGVSDLVLALDGDSGPVAVGDTDAFYGLRWGRGMIVPLEPGDYTLRAYDTDGVDDPGDWAWLWSEYEAAGPGETEPNDTADVATALTTEEGEGEYAGDYVTAGFDGWITAGDVDTFSVPVADGQFVYLTVFTSQVGSLLDATVTVLDVDGSTLGTISAGDTVLSGKRVGGDGTITVQVQGADTESAGYYLATLDIWDSRRPW